MDAQDRLALAEQPRSDSGPMPAPPGYLRRWRRTHGPYTHGSVGAHVRRLEEERADLAAQLVEARREIAALRATLAAFTRVQPYQAEGERSGT